MVTLLRDRAVYFRDGIKEAKCDRLLFYTDGLVETRERAWRFFDLDHQVAAALALPDLGARSSGWSGSFEHSGDGLTDDVLLVLGNPSPRCELPDITGRAFPQCQWCCIDRRSGKQKWPPDEPLRPADTTVGAAQKQRDGGAHKMRLVFADALAVGVLALADLTAHEATTEKVVHQLVVHDGTTPEQRAAA
jgi:hypothetical protein